ncbi:hypothetical protein VN97_g1164 [Penicillium thymicola]|uniref:Uncharacterized protein n=1 Tax=Penicillium thymicola TaxID=293382 RepID=A0AAI9TRL0_PENTH|nr:hypothetical protein VN97_g1164 [Penicillium thymicola]
MQIGNEYVVSLYLDQHPSTAGKKKMSKLSQIDAYNNSPFVCDHLERGGFGTHQQLESWCDESPVSHCCLETSIIIGIRAHPVLLVSTSSYSSLRMLRSSCSGSAIFQPPKIDELEMRRILKFGIQGAHNNALHHFLLIWFCPQKELSDSENYLDRTVLDTLAKKKIGSFSLIERVILSAGAMLIFSVYFHLTICPEGRKDILKVQYNLDFGQKITAYYFC